MYGSGGVGSFASLQRPNSSAFATAENQRLQQQQQQQQYQQPFNAAANSAGPQFRDIGTPLRASAGDKPDNLKLDTKLALLDKHKYSDSAPETWHKKVRTYLVGAHIDMKPFLDLIEGRGALKIETNMLKDLCDP